MKRTIKILLVAIIGVVLAATSLLANPMKKDASVIEQTLLREKPLGTQKADIERWLIDKKKLAPVSSDIGFFRQDPPPSRVVGVKSVKAKLGEYLSFPFVHASVVAYWGFNEKDELIELWVWKTTDAL